VRVWRLAAAARFFRAGDRRAGHGSRRNGPPVLGAPLQRTRAGFSRLQRLNRPAEFGRVFAEALRSQDHFFTVLARANPHNTARLGLTVSRRVAKRAVDRNRLKRLARETFRMLDLPSLDFVVIAKADAKRASAPELRASLEQHFLRLRNKTDRAS
jgi:ribonuclease P protein component